MANALADPRATDLLSAIPDDLATLSSTFRTAAGEAQMTATGLDAARDDATWTGHAADEFHRSIGRLPRQLERVCAGYSAVADALASYEPELSRIQARFVQVIADLSDAQLRLGLAQAAARTAHTTLTGAIQARHPDRGLALAELAAARADGAVDGYHHDIALLSATAMALLDEFSEVRDTCRAAIAVAQRTAPVDPAPAPGATLVDLGGKLTGPAGIPSAVFSAGVGAVELGPEAARERISAMIRQADTLLGTPYVSGGGHGAWGAGEGLDCSGFVSAVLRSGGFLNAPVTTEGFASQPSLAGGPGRLVTIYDRTGCGANEHVIIDLNGRFYEAGGGSGSGGAPFVHQFTPDASYLASFNTVLHPVGL
jgi:hypothetical protein